MYIFSFRIFIIINLVRYAFVGEIEQQWVLKITKETLKSWDMMEFVCLVPGFQSSAKMAVKESRDH